MGQHFTERFHKILTLFVLAGLALSSIGAGAPVSGADVNGAGSVAQVEIADHIGTLTDEMVTISGNAGLSGVTITYDSGSTTTDDFGDYAFSVPLGWAGTVSPSVTGYHFKPVNRTYPAVTEALADQNYWYIPNRYTISGNAGTGGVTLRYQDGMARTVTANDSGAYSINVPYQWTGTVTPEKGGFSFDLPSHNYPAVTGNLTNENFLATPNAATSGQWQCWDDGLPNPCHHNLYDLAVVAATDVWAVGDGGTILHWTGDSWFQVPSPTTQRLRSVAMASSGDGWTVGDGGTILHWNGIDWSATNSITTNDLYTIAIVPGTAGAQLWAGGRAGTLLHRAGGTWTNVENPLTEDGAYALTSINMLSATDGWATSDGYDVPDILHWDGNAWTVYGVSNPSAYSADALYSMDMLSPTDGWAVGASFSSGRSVWHWDGDDWTLVTNPISYSYRALASVSMVPGTDGADGWAVGEDGSMLRWGGSEWSIEASPVPTNWNAVTMVSASDGWAVGDGGAILRWDGDTWVMAAGNPWVWLNAVAMASPSDGWAVGYGGTILRWNGSSWSQVTSPTNENLWSVSFVPGTDGADAWASGDGGTMLHLVSGSWTSVVSDASGEEAPLTGLTMLSPTDGWVGIECGAFRSCVIAVPAGAIAMRWNGVSWSWYKTGSITYDLGPKAVSMGSATDGWAVGSWGGVRHWDGSAWSSLSYPTTNHLFSVDMLSAIDGWAVGNGGIILHRNAISWSAVTKPTTRTLYSVDMVSSSDGWTVGDNGTLAHWNGSAWATSPSPIASQLYSVAMVSATSGWAVGANGAILRYSAPTITHTINGNAGAEGVTLSYHDGTDKIVTSGAGGGYSISVPDGWTGTVTPSKAGYTFNPPDRTYPLVTVNQADQDYAATPITYTISGTAGVGNATLTYTGGSTMAASNGAYSITVPYGWSGSVTPSKDGYVFEPLSTTYLALHASASAQNYVAHADVVISGNAGVDGVTLSYHDGIDKTVTSSGGGLYSITVPYGWTGTVTPSKEGYTFDLPSHSYTTGLTANRADQDFTPHINMYTISGSVGIEGVELTYHDGTDKTVTSLAGGLYSMSVPYGWTGTVTPAKTGYVFEPISLTFPAIHESKSGQDYIAHAGIVISGNADIEGVVLSYHDGIDKSTTTGSGGDYSVTVSYNWTGILTPAKAGYVFDPPSIEYTVGLTTNRDRQDFSAAPIGLSISGNAAVAGATIAYTGGSTTTDGSGNYAFPIPYNWSGTVTPSKAGISFLPASLHYDPVTVDQLDQNYSAIQSFFSNATQDGWILEGGELTGKGASVNSSNAVLRLGDDALRNQYRTILSFTTAELPDDAMIDGAVLTVTKQSAKPSTSNPINTFKGLLLDVKNGYFGTSAALKASDFQATASTPKAGLGPYFPTLTSGKYTIAILSSAFGAINKTTSSGGLTQIRLRFKLDDNNNTAANYLKLYSGSGGTTAPVLTITYHVP